ncbi:MAG: 1-deoxy-D-xylulose-5-phosphate synthase [Ruminococcus sp.]|nr:1-deoxy-D-xylulose-5-phosphate synthase [Ruminococcus sp.]
MKDNLKEDEKLLGQLRLPEDLKELDPEQCKILCAEIRSILIRTVSLNGGHLSSNLGVVELTLAIHRNFNSPEDKIIWDVGHQAYVHKILTGRGDRISTIRQKGGLAGFTRPDESVHDSFISGHSSTSVSVACGIAEAMKLQGRDNYTVAVIGDGAMTGGMAYEAMNNAGKDSLKNLIVILNDNGMSISRNVGSVSKYLTNLRNTEKYLNTKRNVEKTLTKLPTLGTKMARGIKSVKDTVKYAVLENTIFEDMGFVYLGPVNGHKIQELDEIMRMAKTFGKPVFIHVKTKKGIGFRPAELKPDEYHGISRFDINTGDPEISAEDSYSTIFGRELAQLAERDDRICAITAAMKLGTGLQHFADKFPERFFDVGIAEQHAVTFAGGLASMGLIPVFAVYSTFLQRAYDQLLHDVAIGHLHVVLGIDRAGVVGEDGETHQGLFDVALLNTIPGAVVYSPSCYEELRMCMNKAIFAHKCLVAVRYPKGSEEVCYNSAYLSTDHVFMKIGGSGILIISYGKCFNEAYKAQMILKDKGIRCDLLKLTRIIPVDPEITEEMNSYRHIVFFEEAMKAGGVSGRIGDMLSESGYTGSYSRIAVEGFVKQASVTQSLDELGLTAEKMAEYITDRYGSDGKA